MSGSPGTPPDSIGRYRILRVLGQGGQGVVYEAEQDEPRRRVALKVVRQAAHADAQLVHTLQREAQTLANLHHPGIATLYELGVTPDHRPYLAMELVEGPTMGSWLEGRTGSVDGAELELRLRLFLRITEAINHAHQRGVIHRDLKPGNVMLVEDGDTDEWSRQHGHPGVPHPKVLDFGLARLVDPDPGLDVEATEVGVIKGTLEYMSPEQARGDPARIDLRTDVYALGVILYRMLSGRLPIERGERGVMDHLRAVESEEPVPLADVWSGTVALDLDVRTIAHKALQKDPDQRYASCAALGEDVARFLDGRPILARPPSTLYQLSRFARRHRALVGAAVTALLALVAAVFVSTLFALEESAQRRIADEAVADLEDLVQFQAGMIGDLDAGELGRRILADLGARAEDAARARGEDPVPAREDLERALGDVNMTDAALGVIDLGVLAPAARVLDEEFRDRPTIAARMWLTLGWTYRRLGLLARAEEPLERAHALLRDSLGPEAPETLEAENLRAILLEDLGRAEEAEARYADLLEECTRVLGPAHLTTLRVQHNLAGLQLQLERPAEADASFAAVHAAAPADTEAGELLRADARKGRGDVALHVGELEASRAHYEAALADYRRLTGVETDAALDLMSNLAVVLRNLGAVAEAEALYLEALVAQGRVLGEAHPTSLRTMNNLAYLLLGEGRLEDARARMRRVVELAEEGLGPDHPHTGVYLHTLAEVELALERWADAAATLERVRAVYRAADSAPYLPQACVDSARAAARLGDASGALDLLIAAVELGWGDRATLEGADFAPLRDEPGFAELLAALPAGG